MGDLFGLRNKKKSLDQQDKEERNSNAIAVEYLDNHYERLLDIIRDSLVNEVKKDLVREIDMAITDGIQPSRRYVDLRTNSLRYFLDMEEHLHNYLSNNNKEDILELLTERFRNQFEVHYYTSEYIDESHEISFNKRGTLGLSIGIFLNYIFLIDTPERTEILKEYKKEAFMDLNTLLLENGFDSVAWEYQGGKKEKLLAKF